MDALDQFLLAVYEADGDGELIRVYGALYAECYREEEPVQIDWSDVSGDGSLKAKPGARVRRASRRS